MTATMKDRVKGMLINAVLESAIVMRRNDTIIKKKEYKNTPSELNVRITYIRCASMAVGTEIYFSNTIPNNKTVLPA